MEFFDRPRRCLAVLILASLVYFYPLWLHPSELVYSNCSDILCYHYPLHQFAARCWKESHSLPLWNPYHFSGQPFQADLQSNLFYPPHWLMCVVPLSWVAPLMGFLIWAHVLLAGVAMLIYARSKGMNGVSALVAGLGFMFAGKWLVHLLFSGHYVFLPLAWMPLMLWGVEQAIERRRVGPALAAGIVAGIIVTGAHPQLVLYLGLVAAVMSLGSVLVRRRPGEADSSVERSSRAFLGGLRWWALSWGIVGMVAAGLAAVQLLPAAELLTATTRSRSIYPDYGSCWGFHFGNLRELAGQIIAIAGPWPLDGPVHENTGTFGILWVCAAVLAVILCKRPAVRFQAAILALMVLFAFGFNTPFYSILYRIVPGLSLVRIPARILLFAGLPLGLLAGYLTPLILGPSSRGGRSFLLAAGVVTGLAGLYLAGGLLGNHVPANSALGLAVLLLGFVTVLCWRYWQPQSGTGLAVAWLVLLVADLWAMHWHWLDTRPVEWVYPDNDAVRFLAEHPGHYRVLDDPMPEPRHTVLTPGLCSNHQIEWLRGENTTDLIYYKQYFRYIEDSDAPPLLAEIPVLGPIKNQLLLDLLGVRYRFRPADQPLDPDEVPSWRRVKTLTHNPVHEETGGRVGRFSLPPYDVYERQAPVPRAFVVSEARLLPPQAEVRAALRSTDLYRTVFVESPRTLFERSEPARPGCGPGPAFQEARVVTEEPNRVVVEVDRTEPGYLVLLDVWYPGWKCYTEDGQRLPVWRGDTLFRVVPVPAGRQRLEFVFDPAVLRWGEAISLGTMVLLACWGVWGFAQRGKTKRGTGVAPVPLAESCA